MNRWDFTIGMSWGAFWMALTHGSWATAFWMTVGSFVYVLIRDRKKVAS